jgi:hypothetical protein
VSISFLILALLKRIISPISPLSFMQLMQVYVKVNNVMYLRNTILETGICLGIEVIPLCISTVINLYTVRQHNCIVYNLLLVLPVWV